MTPPKKTIIITGSSSGLGAALAKKYANINVLLFLFGRSSERLNEVANICITKGAIVEIFVGDVSASSWMKTQIEHICQRFSIDLIITCAGVSAGTLGHHETYKQVVSIFDTNLYGVINTIMPAIPYMIKNRRGQIALISSMAGMVGLSSAPSYSASKGAVKIFGDALRGYLRQFNVKLSIIIAGYIDTPMTAVNKFPMPLMMSSEQAANIIHKGLSNDKGIIAFPLIMYLLLKTANLLPYRLVDYINSKLPGKPAFDV